jgi:hypothetical protein
MTHTTEIYSAFSSKKKGTTEQLPGPAEAMETTVVCILTGAPTAGTRRAAERRLDKVRLTPVHRALQQGEITLIPAYSPETRGRLERGFRPLQDRQTKAGARRDTERAAGRYLAERFLPAYNRRFAVLVPEVAAAFIPWIGMSSPRCSVQGALAVSGTDEISLLRKPGRSPVTYTGQDRRSATLRGGCAGARIL